MAYYVACGKAKCYICHNTLTKSCSYYSGSSVSSVLLYRMLFLLGLYFRCKAKVLELIPLKFLLQYKS